MQHYVKYQEIQKRNFLRYSQRFTEKEDKIQKAHTLHESRMNDVPSL